MIITRIIKTTLWTVLRFMPSQIKPHNPQDATGIRTCSSVHHVWGTGAILLNHACARLHYMCWICVKVIACPWGSISYMVWECGWGLPPRAAVWLALCNELPLLPTDLMSLWKYITWIPLPSPPLPSLSSVQLCASPNRSLEMDYRTFSSENTTPGDLLPFL